MQLTSPVLRKSIWLSLLIFLCLHFTEQCEGRRIINYNVRSVTRAEIDAPGNEWARYRAPSSATVLSVSETDDADKYSPLSFSAPFFTLEQPTWYAASDGFISPSPFSLCPFFCQDTSTNTLYGSYQFSDDPSSPMYPGGNWPLVGLYVTDLNPGGWSDSVVTGVQGVDTSAPIPVSYIVVSYVNVRPIAYGPSNFPWSPLTAQIVLFSNGTILLRYQDLPVALSGDSDPPMASVGLILSSSQRLVVETPSTVNGITAYRFDPLFSRCEKFVTEADCVAECAWCTTTSECHEKDQIALLCTEQNVVNATTSSNPLTSVPYYEVTLEKSKRFMYFEDSNRQSQVLTAQNDVTISLPFEFPLFKTRAPVFNGTTTLLRLSRASTLSFDIPTCGPLWNTCPDGKYEFAILPFQTSLNWAYSLLTVSTPPPENATSFPCPFPPAEGGACPQWALINLLGIIPYSFPSSSSTNGRFYSLEIYLDDTGVITINTDWSYLNTVETTTFFAYPPPIVGLLRHGVDDPASIVIPPAWIAPRNRIRFTPTNVCDVDCGLNGYCHSDGTCHCSAGFTGSACDACQVGYYGAACAACPTCENGGQCDDGITGSGTCRCVYPHSGATCDETCSVSEQAAACQADCASPRGYCQCGRCVCQNGWSGAGCTVPPADKCLSKTFDGCPVCSQTEGCGFCWDNTCYTQDNPVPGAQYTCSMDVTTPRFCVAPQQPSSGESDYSLAAMILLVFVCAMFLIAIGLIIYVIWRRQRETDIDYHITMASPGVPNFSRGRREREVMRCTFVNREMAEETGLPVLAVPLQQIPLKKLYMLQNGIEPPQKRKEE